MTKEIITAEEYVAMARCLSRAESQLRGLMCPPDDERDRPRVEAARAEVAAAIADMAVAIAATPAAVVEAARTLTVSYPCAGARDGCPTRVRRQGDYCRRCARDAD